MRESDLQDKIEEMKSAPSGMAQFEGDILSGPSEEKTFLIK